MITYHWSAVSFPKVKSGFQLTREKNKRVAIFSGNNPRSFQEPGFKNKLSDRCGEMSGPITSFEVRSSLILIYRKRKCLHARMPIAWSAQTKAADLSVSLLLLLLIQIRKFNKKPPSSRQSIRWRRWTKCAYWIKWLGPLKSNPKRSGSNCSSTASLFRHSPLFTRQSEWNSGNALDRPRMPKDDAAE